MRLPTTTGAGLALSLHVRSKCEEQGQCATVTGNGTLMKFFEDKWAKTLPMRAVDLEGELPESDVNKKER